MIAPDLLNVDPEYFIDPIVLFSMHFHLVLVIISLTIRTWVLSRTTIYATDYINQLYNYIRTYIKFDPIKVLNF